MTANSPEDLHPLFAEAFSNADLEGIMALYEKGARFVERSGRLATGAHEIRGIYSDLFASRAKIEVETKKIIQSEDLALMLGKWTLTAWGADGKAVKRTGIATDVARRQPDGQWLIAIDNPYGVE